MLVWETREYRSFEISNSCDMEELSKPYQNYPPSLFIIGAQRAGTTALARLIENSTVLNIGFQQETRFLSFRSDYFKIMHNQHVSKMEYYSLLSKSSGPTIDGSSEYHAFGRFFIDNLKYTANMSIDVLPKMVFILRNPLSRLYSQYKMRRRWSSELGHRLHAPVIATLESLIEEDLAKLRSCGWDIGLDDPNLDPRVVYEKPNLFWCFHEFVNKERDMYLQKGLYSWQLWMMRATGNPHRIMLTCFQDFRAWNKGFVNMIAEFVGVGVDNSQLWLESTRRRSDCPMLYNKMNDLQVRPMFERKLHRFFFKWNNVLLEDFGIDCGWRRMLVC